MKSGSDSDLQPPYIYQPLTQPDSIRLLRLQPGTPDSEHVHFTLYAARLDDRPSYEAISYCWGDPTDTRIVFCAHKVLHVTASLYTALKRLRHADRERILWADAVCINQKDNDEKGRQVQLMSRIYAQPTRVLIWLGEDTAGLDGLAECLRGAKEVLPPETHDFEVLYENSKEVFLEANRLRREGKPNFLDHNWAPMNNLLCRPWFDRRWIIQEVVLADDSVPRVAICGGIEFPWEDLASVAYRIGSYMITPVIAGLSIINWRAPCMFSFLQHDARPLAMLPATFFVYMMRHYRQAGSLVDAIVATTLFKCSDPRDHLYSLLSLPQKRSNVLPDYNSTVEQVFLNFARTTLVGQQNLRILSLAPHTAFRLGALEVNRLKLPSWVPDLSCQGSVQPLVSYTIRRQLFRAGGDEKSPVRTSDDGHLLHVRGRIIDKVEEMAASSADIPFPPESEVPEFARIGISAQFKLRMMRWLQGCRSVAAKGDWKGRAAGDAALRRAFSETLLCGMTGMRDRLPEDVLAAVEDYVGYVFDSFDPDFRLTEEMRERLLTYGGLIEQSLLGVAETRCLCRTEGERLGQVRREARAGDVFCVVVGAEVPYVLRPNPGKEGRYALVGDAYLHGVMQGEAMADERYQTVDIVIE
ncbi:hypothetical protein VTK56DRAFT_1558 [Thermocarpiscus australiensis]